MHFGTQADMEDLARQAEELVAVEVRREPTAPRRLETEQHEGACHDVSLASAAGEKPTLTVVATTPRTA